MNYQRTAELLALTPGARVLDCFSFQGGFALHAARAGAAHVLGLDQSADAVATAKRALKAGELLDGEGGYTVWAKKAGDTREFAPLIWNADTGKGRVTPQELIQTYAAKNPDLTWTPTARGGAVAARPAGQSSSPSTASPIDRHSSCSSSPSCIPPLPGSPRTWIPTKTRWWCG